MKTNDCYACRFKGEVPGSVHICCNFVEDHKARLLLMMLVVNGQGGGMFAHKETGESLIDFNPHGVKNGWCSWPINFDPVWVKCKLPI